MKDEVEDFLRRVAQMRAQAEAKGQQQRPVEQPPRPAPLPKPPRQKPPARLVPARLERPQPMSVEAELVDAELAEKSNRVGRQVLEDLRGSEQIAEHTRHLGEEVDLADDKMKAHLHQVFDHQLGHLRVTSGETALVKADRSSSELSLDQIMRLLSSSASVRDAIVMSEILRRPEW